MRVLKYRLHPGMNVIPVLEDGYHLKLRYLDDQDGKLCGWFEEKYVGEPMLAHNYEVYLALTGEQFPDEYCYCTSHQVQQGGGYFVVHAYD